MSNPLVFRLFKTHHERAFAEQYKDRIWSDSGSTGTMQVRAIKATDRVMDSHVTYVAVGANSHDVRRRFFDEWDEDENAVDEYTTVVTIDLDALGLTHVDRVAASDAFYAAILETRKALLPTVSAPRIPAAPRPREELLPYDLPEPPNEVVEKVVNDGQTFSVTYAKTSERRWGIQWDEVEMKAISVVDGKGHAFDPVFIGLMLAGLDEKASYWVPAPKTA